MKKFLVNSEYVEAGVWSDLRKSNTLADEIVLSYSKEENPEGSCDYEFMIEYHSFQGSGGALRLGVFSDSFLAFDTCPEVFDLLKQNYYNRSSSKITHEDFLRLCDDLERIGWKRQHPVSKPKPPRCEKCHQVLGSEECVR